MDLLVRCNEGSFLFFFFFLPNSHLRMMIPTLFHYRTLNCTELDPVRPDHAHSSSNVYCWPPCMSSVYRKAAFFMSTRISRCGTVCKRYTCSLPPEREDLITIILILDSRMSPADSMYSFQTVMPDTCAYVTLSWSTYYCCMHVEGM